MLRLTEKMVGIRENGANVIILTWHFKMSIFEVERAKLSCCNKQEESFHPYLTLCLLTKPEL